MNMQAMLRQAQKIQSEMMKEKKAIDETLFEGNSELVTIKAYGNRNIERSSPYTLQTLEKVLKEKVEEYEKEIANDVNYDY